MGQTNFFDEKRFGLKKFWVQNNLGSKEILRPKIFWFKNLWFKKKIWGQENFGLKITLGLKKNLGPN